jgi:hypothetical protein
MYCITSVTLCVLSEKYVTPPCFVGEDWGRGMYIAIILRTTITLEILKQKSRDFEASRTVFSIFMLPARF